MPPGIPLDSASRLAVREDKPVLGNDDVSNQDKLGASGLSTHSRFRPRFDLMSTINTRSGANSKVFHRDISRPWI